MTKFSKLTSETFVVHLAYLKGEHLSLQLVFFRVQTRKEEERTRSNRGQHPVHEEQHDSEHV